MIYKALVRWSLAGSLLAVLSQPVQAIRWPDNTSYRVYSMAGAGLGIEDETTELNLFNYENGAGLMLVKKMNRLDLAAFYSYDAQKQSGTVETEITTSDLELTRPGAEYRGVTYWLSEDLLLRAGVEALALRATITQKGVMTDTSDAINVGGLGGGLGLGYRTPIGLPVFAGLAYRRANGRPEQLDQLYNVYGAAGGNTTQYDLTATNLEWNLSTAYQLQGLGSEGELNLGLLVANGDDMPNAATLGTPPLLATPNPLDYGDYWVRIDSSGTEIAGGYGLQPLTDQQTYISTPLRVSGQAIYSWGPFLQAGLIVDNKHKQVQFQEVQTLTDLGLTQKVDYQIATSNLLGWTPVARLHLPLAEGWNGLAGVQFSTWGSGQQDLYALNGSTPYRSSHVDLWKDQTSLGLGLQGLNRQLQAAFQLESGKSRAETAAYLPDGSSASSLKLNEDYWMNLRGGAEYWMLPPLAFRLGYVWLHDYAVAASHVYTNTYRWTLGLGLSLPDGTSSDLFVRLDQITVQPSTPTHTTTGVYWGLRLPL